jgi:hypothetical protein
MIISKQHIKLELLVIVCFSLSLNGFSQNYTWNGSQSSNWNNANNWTPNTIPNSTSHNVFINNASVNYECILDTIRTLRSLNISDGIINLNGYELNLDIELVAEGGIIKNGKISSKDLLKIENTRFEGEMTIVKISSTAGINDLNGGNLFLGNTTFINQDNNRLWLAITNGDTFKANATFIRQSTGLMEVARFGNNLFEGDINCYGSIKFGQNNGRVNITGNDSQNIFWDSIGDKPVFKNFIMNTLQNGEIYLKTPINISDSLLFINGIINSYTTNIVSLADESTYTSIGNTYSFINGPMDYVFSNNALNGFTLHFPIGKKLLPKNYYPEYYVWRPLSLLVGHTSNTSYTYRAEMFNLYNYNLGWTLPNGVDTASRARTWDIQRFLTSNMTNEPSNQLRTSSTSGQRPIITLHFGYSDSVYDGNNLTILKNTPQNPNAWIDIGGTGAPNYNNRNPLVGNITSTNNNFNSFSTFTLGSLTNGLNPLPIKLLNFEASIQNKNIVIYWTIHEVLNLAYYELEKSLDGNHWFSIDKIDVKSINSGIKKYYSIDNQIINKSQYYRLKIVYKDSSYEFSKTILTDFVKNEILVYPNPAKDKILISLPDIENSTISWKINDKFGKTVSKGETINNESIDLSDLSNGFYYLEIISKNNIVYIKLNISK